VGIIFHGNLKFGMMEPPIVRIDIPSTTTFIVVICGGVLIMVVFGAVNRMLLVYSQAGSLCSGVPAAVQ